MFLTTLHRAGRGAARLPPRTGAPNRCQQRPVRRSARHANNCGFCAFLRLPDRRQGRPGRDAASLPRREGTASYARRASRRRSCSMAAGRPESRSAPIWTVTGVPSTTVTRRCGRRCVRRVRDPRACLLRSGIGNSSDPRGAATLMFHPPDDRARLLSHSGCTRTRAVTSPTSWTTRSSATARVRRGRTHRGGCRSSACWDRRATGGVGTRSWRRCTCPPAPTTRP